MRHTCHTSVACMLSWNPSHPHTKNFTLGQHCVVWLGGKWHPLQLRQYWRDLCAKRDLKLLLAHQSDPYLGRFLGARRHSTVEALWKIRAVFSDPVTTRPVCSSGSESVCLPQVTAELLIFMLAKLQAGRLIRWYVFSLGLWGQVELPH